jgi:pimeloyl-ACP methyl ester carboxylesterase
VLSIHHIFTKGTDLIEKDRILWDKVHQGLKNSKLEGSILKMFILFFGGLLSITTHAEDICETKFTLMHYAESVCFDIPRPIEEPGGESFFIHTVLVTEKLSEKNQKDTIVIVPGGPGESAEPLKTGMQKKEIINSFWHSLNLNVVLFDPRGTGMSTFPQKLQTYGASAVSSDRRVEDLKAVIEAVSPQKPVILLAHSAGGHTVMALAEKYPALVHKIILISASVSARQMGQLTMGLQAKESFHGKRIIEQLVPPFHKQDIYQKYLRIEDVLQQQLKARILKHFVHPDLKPISPLDFREMMIRRFELDRSGGTVVELIEKYFKTFAEMDQQGPLLVPSDLRQKKITAANMNPSPLDNKQWYIRQIVCNEGLTESDINTEIYYDGLTMRYLCGETSQSHHIDSFEPQLENINIPVLYFSGREDTQVPTYVAEDIVARLPRATLVVESETGHIFFDNKPWILYKNIELFLQQ